METYLLLLVVVAAFGIYHVVRPGVRRERRGRRFLRRELRFDRSGRTR